VKSPAERPDTSSSKRLGRLGVLEKHPRGFSEFKALITDYTPQRVAEITGLSVEALYQAAEILAMNRPSAVIWSIGIADRTAGRANVQSLANLQMLLGNLDKAGGGVNPLGSHNNTQGASDMGASPGYLPGYQALADAAARHKFEQAWGVTLPDQPGLPAPEILQAACQDQIRRCISW
jgi:predicted molibdopterin-dependent oxidoreductase YjgC